jgi:hypothetical protein
MRKLLFHGFILFASFLLLSINFASAQNPGFEANAAGSTSATGWVLGTTSTSWSIGDVNPRSGTKRLNLTITTSVSSKSAAHTSGYSVTIPGSGSNHIHVIGYIRETTAGTDNGWVSAFNGTAASPTTATPTDILSAGWTRVTSSGPAVNGTTYYPRFHALGNNTASTGDLYAFDDIIIYTSTTSTVDLTKPNAPTGLSTTVNGSNVRLSWTPGTDQATDISGIDGVLILRADGINQSAPPVLDQAYYSTTSAIGPNQIVSGGVTWTVVSNLNPSSPFDDAVSTTSSYTYAIYMRDRAYNYSAAAVVNYDACSVTPTITTTLAATSIGATGASSGGQTLSAGTGCAISVKGVCWNTTGTVGGAAPTVADSKTTDGSGTANFNSSLTSLLPQTLYYVRAYATNQRGTSYGDEISFRTLSPELAAHPASFSAQGSCSDFITLRFSALNTIPNAFGYLIILLAHHQMRPHTALEGQ